MIVKMREQFPVSKSNARNCSDTDGFEFHEGHEDLRDCASKSMTAVLFLGCLCLASGLRVG